MSRFTDDVLEAVNCIPYGKVASYGQIALMIGVPRAAIQVGWVLHQNGDKSHWWRIVNKEGKISTTCSDHDANMQKQLLENEGIPVSDNYQVDMTGYRFMS